MLKRNVTLTLKLPTAKRFHTHLSNTFSPSQEQDLALTKVRTKLAELIARATAINQQHTPKPQIAKTL